MAYRVAVVTGANRGLGFAVVKALCCKFPGFVYLTAKDEALGYEAVMKLNQMDLKPCFHQLDITDCNSVRTFADVIKEMHGGFDVLVNNAGILHWDQVYPSYEVATRDIDVNYRGLLTIEKFLYPLLRKSSRVVNISGACGHLSNLKNKRWLQKLLSRDLNVKRINEFVEEYLECVKKGIFDTNDFADDGKHAEHRVSKIALTALTMVQQKEYLSKCISINALNPGHMNTDMTQGCGVVDPDEAAQLVSYLIFDASPDLKGTFMWEDGEIIDWKNENANLYCKGIW